MHPLHPSYWCQSRTSKLPILGCGVRMGGGVASSLRNILLISRRGFLPLHFLRSRREDVGAPRRAIKMLALAVQLALVIGG